MKNLRYAASLVAGLALVGVVALVLRQGPRAGSTLVVGLSADVTTFEPANISSRDNMNIAHHIFGSLFTLDADGTHVPDLATAMEISEDGTAYTYTLRQGLTCHDGEALTAEDAAYSFNRIADPANRFTGNAPGFVFTSIGFKRAEALDDLRVRITIARKNPIAFGLLTEINLHCKDSYEKMTLDQASTTPIGSGRYRLASWTRGSEIVLEKVGEAGTFDRIVWRIIPEASTRSAELIAGNVDIITNVAPDQIDAINASTSAAVQSITSTRRMYVGFNLAESFRQTPGGRAIQDPRVRRALQYAVDVPTICRQLLHVECERATGLVNRVNANPRLRPYPFEPATAERLLDEAGWGRGADGVRFPITLQAGRGRYLNDANVVQAIGQYLKDVGIGVQVELLEWASVYTPLIRERSAGPLFFLGTGGALWSPVYDMNDIARVDSGTNYTNWTDERWFGRWDALIDAATPEESRRIIDEMLQVFYDDGPWLHLYFQPDFYGVSSRIAWQARPDERVYGFEARPRGQAS
ncbi:MAG: ABC transporter substrate-binding protein, partial [Acidobacteriota bacterium]|nr:ABC transporter substrate-binding protein [Acidobacteriota bacterium]